MILTLDVFYVSPPRTTASISVLLIGTRNTAVLHDDTTVAIVVDVAGAVGVDVDVAAVYCCFVVSNIFLISVAIREGSSNISGGGRTI